MATTTKKETTTETTALQEQKQPAQANASERFMNKVMSEFTGNVSGGLQITDYQRQLAQGYFIGIDRSLQIAEEARLAKNGEIKNKIE